MYINTAHVYISLYMQTRRLRLQYVFFLLSWSFCLNSCCCWYIIIFGFAHNCITTAVAANPSQAATRHSAQIQNAHIDAYIYNAQCKNIGTVLYYLRFSVFTRTKHARTQTHTSHIPTYTFLHIKTHFGIEEIVKWDETKKMHLYTFEYVVNGIVDFYQNGNCWLKWCIQ